MGLSLMTWTCHAECICLELKSFRLVLYLDRERNLGKKHKGTYVNISLPCKTQKIILPPLVN